MKQIKLTKGQFALVDDDMFEYLNQWKWHLSSHGYAMRRPPRSKVIYMHRVINNTSDSELTDHVNRNKLDNRKKNLRGANRFLNGINRGKNKNNTSGYKGVSSNKRNGKWQAFIHYSYKRYYLGDFIAIEDAVEARKQAERRYWA